MPTMIQFIRDLISSGVERAGRFNDKLLSANAGQGPSVTRFAYLWASIAAIFCGTLLVLGGVIVYLKSEHKADGIYWTAVGAFWINLFGFVTALKMRQATVGKEIALATAPAKGGSNDTGDNP